MKQLQPLKGFRDIFPKEKASQNYIFETMRNIAALFGYEEYEGPIVEPLDLYTGKTSAEILERQTFQVRGQGDEKDKWILRPEMTPSLARMIAANANNIPLPVRLFNIGPRFRYEAPQKGRSREFYQVDFDLLGSTDVLADAEVLNILVTIFKAFGADEKSIKIGINSRKFMETKLKELGIAKDELKKTLIEIDRMDKETGNLENEVVELIKAKIDPNDDPYFKKLFEILSRYGISDFFSIDLSVVRGLDYYTGLVFEVKDNGDIKRTLLGGGRYDNLVSEFNPNAQVPGVGLCFSDVVLLEFLKEKNLLPELKPKKTKVLVTIFAQETLDISLDVSNELRQKNIPVELFPDSDKKLDKQLKYADRMKIPFVVIIGPEEAQKGVYKLKNMQTQKQQELTKDQLLTFRF